MSCREPCGGWMIVELMVMSPVIRQVIRIKGAEQGRINHCNH